MLLCQQHARRRIGQRTSEMSNLRLFTVIVRAAVIAVPRVVRIIIRRVVRSVTRFGRVLRIDIVRVSASTNQNSEQPRAQQCRCEIESFFKDSFHKRFGALI